GEKPVVWKSGTSQSREGRLLRMGRLWLGEKDGSSSPLGNAMGGPHPARQPPPRREAFRPHPQAQQFNRPTCLPYWPLRTAVCFRLPNARAPRPSLVSRRTEYHRIEEIKEGFGWDSQPVWRVCWCCL